MDRFSSYSPSPYAAQMTNRSQRATRSNAFKDPDTQDDLGSISGSDDGSYAIFHDSAKQEVDHEPEAGADLVLTSQTLNADGTPKRPMNAFMIFARRRRPQVSAENQAMRTGEISKLLSKEWSTMVASEKQFYQDQAKLLKDTFNTKYPDYVYRRRPNNSRRRRRSLDANTKPAEGITGDGGEDATSIGDFESPTDGEEHFDESGESTYSRGSHEPPSFGELKYTAGPAPLSHPSTQPSEPLYHNGNAERLPYQPSSERLSHGMSHRYSNPSLNYSLTSSYSNDMASPQSWHPRIDRVPTAVWPDSTQDRSLQILKTGNYPGSPPGGWPASLSSSGHSSSTPSYGGFPTLNAPFYPSQSNLSDYSNNSGSGNSQYESEMSLQPLDRSYDSRGQGSLAESLDYPPPRNMSRALPPVASISGYPPQVPSEALGSSQYWSRS